MSTEDPSRWARVATRAVFAAALVVSVAGAQQVAVPIRQLSVGGEVASTPFKNLGGIRPLSDGRVIVNDPGARRLILLDSSLRRGTDLLDTVGQTTRAYPSRSGAILSYTGDSSLFVDPVALSMLVLDSRGKIVREIATPRLTGRMGLFGLDPTHGGAFDGHGHLVFAADDQKKRPAAQAGQVGSMLDPDSVLILRFDLTKRTIDTVAAIMRVLPFRFDSAMGPDGRLHVAMVRHPLTAMDGWAVRADGTVGVVRALDYHVDWFAQDGTKRASPRISHEWVRITDSAKAAILDSARAADAAITAMFAARRDSANRRRGGNEEAPTARSVACCGGWTFQLAEDTPFSVVWATPNDLPDYVRPLPETLGSVRGDADGNLWITSFRPDHAPGGTVYDIVNRDGVLVDRVQIPGGTFLEGLGPGVVYLGSREGTGYALARVRIR